MRNTKGLCGQAQRTYGTTDPGGVWHPVHRRECLTILLGTYAENGQCNRHGRRPALYSVQPAYACIVAAAYLGLSQATVRLLLKDGCTHSLHSLDVGMYSTKLTEDIGVLEQRRKLSCMACPFHTPMNHASTRARWWLFDLQIPIGRNGGTGTSRLYRMQCSSSSVDCIVHFRRKYLKDC